MANIAEMTKYFEYLDNLRESGVTNMYGAGSYLTSAFALGNEAAENVLTAWMDTFSLETPAAERAELATVA